MTPHFRHLGVYGDWVAHAPGPRGRAALPDRAAVRRLVAEVLAVPDGDTAPSEEAPGDLRVERSWERDGVRGEELSWSVGFGPRTHAWLLRPRDEPGPLPGVLALHSHDGFKWYGKEKVADGPDPVPPVVASLRRTYYEGRAWANDLAREGYAVLVPDVFCWGSRRFGLDDMPPLMRSLADRTVGTAPPDDAAGAPDDVAHYNAAAWHHEHVVEKYCTLLGTTMAAVVAREDRIALAVLRARTDTTDRTGAVGLSGGGCRAALLRATSPHVTAAVVVGMMSTYDALLDRDVVNHTWMLMPPGLAGRVDWPDVAACRAPAPLLVQYARDDAILPLAGSLAADARIAAHYAAAGAPGAYTGQVVDGPHAFDAAMQRAAFGWLGEHLRRGPGGAAGPPGGAPAAPPEV